MSNNYNSTLQSNNTDLQAILNTINELPEAGGDPVLQDKTITPTTSKQTVTADSGYDGLDTVTVNAMPTATQATPTVTINSSGLITATATQTAGYVAAGTKSATKQLAFQAAKTITPSTTSQTAVSSGYYTGGNITVAGDSNLIAGNIKNGTTIFGVTGTYVGSGGGSGGDTSQEDGLITGTIKNCTNDRVTSIGNNAFYYYGDITSVNFPACKSIGHSAFYYCGKLTSINFPACTSIQHYAFYACGILSANFPMCTTVSHYAFARCTSMTSINFPVCTYISNSAFQQCGKLESISFPVCSFIGVGAFQGCTGLTSINFPECTVIDGSAFSGCQRLTTVNLPKCKKIGGNAFSSCYSLYSISLPACQEIYGHAFRYCSNLTQIYLGSTRMCTLVASTAFVGAGITSSTGSIFVPASLLASYKAATNWTLFSNRIFSYAF